MLRPSIPAPFTRTTRLFSFAGVLVGCGALLMVLVGCGQFLALDPNDPNTTLVPQNNFNAYVCSCDCKNTGAPIDPAHSVIVNALDDGVRLKSTNRTRLDRGTL